MNIDWHYLFGPLLEDSLPIFKLFHVLHVLHLQFIRLPFGRAVIGEPHFDSNICEFGFIKVEIELGVDMLRCQCLSNNSVFEHKVINLNSPILELYTISNL